MDDNRMHKYSPFERISNELVNEIFMFSFGPQSAFSQFHSMRLSHVCTRWRDIAISNGRLWNKILLAPWRSEREMRNSLAWTKELIRRTREAPVHLSIFAYDWHKSWDEAVTPLFMQLESQVSRIDITTSYWQFPANRKLMKAISQTKGPLLKTIIITIDKVKSPFTLPCDNITLVNTFPKLRTLIYDGVLTHNLLPDSSFGYITTFAASLTFSEIRQTSEWLGILKCMSNLENLYFTFWRPAVVSPMESDTPEIYLSHLRNFQMSASRQECAELGKYLKLPPDCTVGIECIETKEIFLFGITYAIPVESEAVIRQVILRWSEETRLDVSDKRLQLDIYPNFLRVAIYSRESTTRPIFMLKLSTSYVTGGTIPNILEQHEDKYVSLANLVRMMHTMCLTNAAEITLHVHQYSLFESFAAPVLGPFVRACTLAKKLHLTGDKVMFMLPILKNRIVDREEQIKFDLAFFADNTAWSFHQYLQDVIGSRKPDPGLKSVGTSFASASTLQAEEETEYCTIERSMETQKMITICLLHANFDVTTVETNLRLLNVLRWVGKQSKVLKELREKSGVESGESSSFPDDDYVEDTDRNMVVEKASKFGAPTPDDSSERETV